jgi:F0F1-type ATP synthase membrane subunit b/b'
MSFERQYYDVLRVIARGYQSTDKLRKHAGQYGLSYEEELEMAYENIQTLANNAIKGRRKPK